MHFQLKKKKYHQVFSGAKQVDYKAYPEEQKSKASQKNPEKEEPYGGAGLPTINTYCKACN